jgi:hypothetical protein
MKKLLNQGNIINFIVILLMSIILLQNCSKPNPGDYKSNKSDTTVVVVNHFYRDTTHTKPFLIKGERDTVLESSIQYYPSDNYSELYEQFNALKQSLLSKNIYQDSLKLDTFGYIKLIDTIQRNLIIGRSFIKNLNIPTKIVIVTNTIYPPFKRQLFIGGGIEGSNNELIKQINAGFMYKNRRDQLYGIYGGLNTNGEWSVGVNSYWKIKLHK